MNETDTWEKECVPSEMERSFEEFPFIVPEDSLPEEVFQVMHDRKTLLVPRLQSMTSYITLHYKSAIKKSLSQYLNDKVSRSEKQYSGVANVTRLDFKRMDFWGFGKYTLEACVCLNAVIDFGKRHDIEREYYAVLEFYMSNQIELMSVDITDHQMEVDENSSPWCTALDKYLIPVMNKAKIEEKADVLLQDYNYDGWVDQHENIPSIITHKMGLTIKELPLHNCKKNKSQLFFKKGTVTIDTDQKDEKDLAITKRVDIDANTIVINTNAVHKDHCMLELYHECVHYEWHYMFYMLQDMHTNDLRKIKKTRSVKLVGKSRADALSWLEFQAVHGSFAVWMPREFMNSEISKRKSRFSKLHPGAQYEAVCREIASEYKIPPYRVRARIIRMGQIEARGALNYLDDHFVDPFSFSHDAGSGNYTFFIDREQFIRNYAQDKEFRKLIDSRKFVYVDGHVCINDTSYYSQTSVRPRLKLNVLEHIDKYCLRFVEVYERDEIYIYRFGRLHSDQEYNNHFLYFPPEDYSPANPRPNEDVQLQKNMRYIRKMPRYFPDLLVKLMDDCKVTVEELADRTGMSSRTINRLRNEPRAEYSLDQIVAIIISLHLPPWVSDELLEAASIKLSGNLAAFGYKGIITCMFMDSYEIVKKDLEKMGVKNIVLDDPIV